MARRPNHLPVGESRVPIIDEEADSYDPIQTPQLPQKETGNGDAPTAVSTKPTPRHWLVAVFCSLAMLLSLGAALNLNLFVDAIRDQFDVDYSSASWVIGTALALIQGLGPVAAVVLETFGYGRSIMVAGFVAGLSQFLVLFIQHYAVLVLILGVVYGCAHAITLVGAVTVPSLLFDDKTRHIALSISFTGIALAQSILPVLCNVTNEVYTWRGSVAIIGGLTLNIIATGAIIPPIKAREQSFKEKLNVHLFRNPRFIGIMSASFLLQFVGIGVGAFYVSELRSDYGLSQQDVTVVMSVFGVMMILGRLSVSLVRKSELFPRWCAFCLYTGLFGILVAVLGVTRAGGFWVAIAIMTFIGLLVGAIYPMHAVAICDLFPPSDLTPAFGYTNLALGLGSLAGPPLVGLLRDATGNFAAGYLVMGLLGAVVYCGSIVVFFVIKLR